MLIISLGMRISQALVRETAVASSRGVQINERRNPKHVFPVTCRCTMNITNVDTLTEGSQNMTSAPLLDSPKKISFTARSEAYGGARDVVM